MQVLDSPTVCHTWEHIRYNDLIYNLYNTLIIICNLIKNICDVLNLTNMSKIKSNFLLGGVLLLEPYRNCILNHCSGPIIHALKFGMDQ